MSAFCMKCGSDLAVSPRARGHNGPASWCINCPPSEKYLWDRCTVQSKTGWAGGRVGMDAEDENGDDFDPRDSDGYSSYDAWSGGVIQRERGDGGAPMDSDSYAIGKICGLGLRRDRVTAGPLAGIDLVRYMRTGVVAKLGVKGN